MAKTRSTSTTKSMDVLLDVPLAVLAAAAGGVMARLQARAIVTKGVGDSLLNVTIIFASVIRASACQEPGYVRAADIFFVHLNPPGNCINDKKSDFKPALLSSKNWLVVYFFDISIPDINLAAEANMSFCFTVVLYQNPPAEMDFYPSRR